MNKLYHMKFYFRITFGKYINRCLFFNGLNKPYFINATEIRNDLSFKEINL